MKKYTIEINDDLARFYKQMAVINEIDTKTQIEDCLYTIADILSRESEKERAKAKKE